MSDAPPSHDTQKILSDLKDHLARHDKPIAFLFGAGTSCAVTVESGDGSKKPLIPAVPELTALCKTAAGELGDKFAPAWDLIENECKETAVNPNVESILSRVRMMLSAVSDADTLCGLGRGELDELEKSIRRTIAESVNPNLAAIGDNLPHRQLARWLVKTARQQPVEIFTVNYDVLIEHALESERVPTFDGFVGGYRPFFHPDSLRRSETAPGANWTRLWKMHGSVTWRRTLVNGRERITRGEPDPAGEMILPSFQKYDESRQQPYVAFTDRLSRFLDQDDALLVVAGFSFSDEHINNLIFGALENRPRTHVYALQFNEPDQEADLARRALQRSNMIVLGPESGIIGGQRAAWAAVESPSLLRLVFETAGAGEGAGEGSGAGRMKIGDFACFCALLGSMTAG